MSDYKFEAGKEYVCRDGRKARVYATDGGESESLDVIHGAVFYGPGWIPTSWWPSGRRLFAGPENPSDLMPPKRGWWVNVYDYDHPYCYPTREIADKYSTHRIACVYIEEGDGL